MALAEFLALPEQEPPLEYFEGRVTQKVSPKGEHSTLHDELVWRLNLAARPNRMARVYPELRTTYANASRVPDIAVYRRDRVPRKPSGEVASDFFDPPDIAIEIISPGQPVAGLLDRCRWFVEHGVTISLFVNWRNRTVLRFRLDVPEQTLRSTDRIDLDEVLPGFELSVQELFDALRLD